MDSSNRLPRIARRMNQIAPFHVMELLTRARCVGPAGGCHPDREGGVPG